MDFTGDNIQSRRLLLIIASIVVVAGLFLRLYAPDLDPPQTVGTNSQALVTDPGNLIYFAANDARFGESEPFPYPKWRVFKVSLISTVAYAVFGLSEVSPLTVNIVGTIPPMLGIILIAAGFWINSNSRHGPWAACIACLLLSLNFTLITYNREPFLESALLFYSGLLFFLYQRFGLIRTNVLVMAAVISLACLTGKLFAIVFFGVVGAVILVSDRPAAERLRLLGLFAAGDVLSIILFLFLLFGNDIGAYVSYLSEHIINAGSGQPTMEPGYKYFARYMTFGTKTHLFSLSPFLFMATYVSLAYFAIRLRVNATDFRRDGSLLFLIFWFIILFLMLDQSYYSPLRYQVLLLAPAAGIVAHLFLRIFDVPIKKASPLANGVSTLCIFILSWFAFNILLLESVYRASSNTAHWTTLLISFFVAAGFTGLLQVRKIVGVITKKVFVIRRIAALLLILSAGYQLYSFADWAKSGTYNRRDASRDIAAIIGPDAILTGSYASAMTINNELRYFIYFFGLDKPELDLFRDIGVTHLAVEHNEALLAEKKYGIDSFTTTLAQYRIRDHYFSLLRVLPVRGLSDQAYQPTAYERANDAIDSGEYDIADQYNAAFLSAHPGSRSGLMQKYLIYEGRNSGDDKLALLDDIRRRFPADPVVRLFYEQKSKSVE